MDPGASTPLFPYRPKESPGGGGKIRALPLWPSCLTEQPLVMAGAGLGALPVRCPQSGAPGQLWLSPACSMRVARWPSTGEGPRQTLPPGQSQLPWLGTLPNPAHTPESRGRASWGHLVSCRLRRGQREAAIVFASAGPSPRAEGSQEGGGEGRPEGCSVTPLGIPRGPGTLCTSPYDRLPWGCGPWKARFASHGPPCPGPGSGKQLVELNTYQTAMWLKDD